MTVHWNRIIAFILALIAFWIFMKNPQAIGHFLASMQNIGPGHSTDEMTLGLISLGIIGVLIVAIVKILVNSRDK